MVDGQKYLKIGKNKTQSEQSIKIKKTLNFISESLNYMSLFLFEIERDKEGERITQRGRDRLALMLGCPVCPCQRLTLP